MKNKMDILAFIKDDKLFNCKLKTFMITEYCTCRKKDELFFNLKNLPLVY